ncbi:MAG: hypothetical protein K8S97_17350, partial [Anaerolineae bacterium]|nr:hypothetical protein [Anaerolineae bacterium]
MFGQRTSLPYWWVAPILQGKGDPLLGVILWAVIGAALIAALYVNRGRRAWGGVLLGAVVGGVGGVLSLAPLWFELLPALARRCSQCNVLNRSGAATCSGCGHTFTEQPRAESTFAGLSNLARVIITLELALLVGGLVLELSGKDALDTYRVLFEWALGTERARA